MTRILNSECVALVGKKVTIKGWVNSVRSYGKLAFADIRDRSGLIQVVGGPDVGSLKNEYVVEIDGAVRARSEKYFNDKLVTGKIEIEVEKINVLAKPAELPFDLHQPDINISLPIALDNRAFALRNKKIQDVFIVQATIVQAFREYLDKLGFTEIFIPTIVAGSTEGGSEVFPVKYFDYQAFLAQSPQLYKQVLTSIFERVYTVAHA